MNGVETKPTVVERLADRILREKGFIVIAFHGGVMPCPKVGDVINESLDGGIVGGRVYGPFLVSAVTTSSEWIEQAERYAGSRMLAAQRAQSAMAFFRLTRVEA